MEAVLIAKRDPRNIAEIPAAIMASIRVEPETE